MPQATWEENDVTWGGSLLTSKNFLPAMLDGLTFFSPGNDAAISLDVYIERKAVVHENGLIVQGQLVWPQFLGPDGGIVLISLGAADTPDGAVTWEGPYNFVLGTDTFLDFLVTGKYLAIRFESSTVSGWTLQSYIIDYDVIGLN